VTRQRAQRLLALGAVLVGLAGMALLHFGMDIEWNEESLRSTVGGLGALAPLALIAIMAFRPFLFLPSWLLMVASGLLFGPVLGSLYSVIGGTLGAALIFGIARAWGRDSVQAYLGVGSMRAFEQFLAQRGVPWLALYTAIPFSPLTAVFAGAALSRLPFPRFFLASLLGFVPRSVLLAVAGRAVAEPTGRNVALAVALLAVAVAATYLGRRWLGLNFGSTGSTDSSTRWNQGR
jgi:uncharacterized membrane protein YdjX (TVP38/TMEM64 family)